MENIAKKIMIGLLLGVMQLGFNTSVFASPLDNYPHMQRYEKEGNHDERRGEERRHREEQENHRHKEEMKRHPHERDEDWQERQRIENRRHEDAVKKIAHDVLDIIFDD